jgi:hypothetical protein
MLRCRPKCSLDSSRDCRLSDLIAEPEGPSFISGTVARHRVDRRCS